MNDPKPYNIYTESGLNAPVVTLAADEGLLSITVEPDGTNEISIDLNLANLDRKDQIKCKGPWANDWQGALVGPGTITFGNVVAGHYVVTTVKR